MRDDWRSPFIAASVTGVAAFIQAAHKPPKPLCKKFFAVLQKDRYERDKHLLIYKILDVTDCEDNEIRLQSVPCPAHLAGFFFQSYDRYRWDSAVEEQALYYGEGARWDDDSPGSQVMALVVLDDVSTEACPFVSFASYSSANNDYRLFKRSSTTTLRIRGTHTFGWRTHSETFQIIVLIVESSVPRVPSIRVGGRPSPGNQSQTQQTSFARRQSRRSH